MLDNRRHAPLAQRRLRLAALGGLQADPSTLGRMRRRRGDVFSDDLSRKRAPGGFRWLVTTFLAAGVGSVAVVALLLGSSDTILSRTGVRSILESPSATGSPEARRNNSAEAGLRWATPKSDRLRTMTGTVSARFLIQDSLRVRQKNRDVIVNHNFMRLVGRLAPASTASTAAIPAFNPYQLYAAPGAEGGATPSEDTQDIATRLLELPGGLLPIEDSQEMDLQDAVDAVLQVLAAQDDVAHSSQASIRGGFQPEGTAKRSASELLAERSARAQPEALPPQTSALSKNVFEADEAVDDIDTREVKVVKVARGQTLTRILRDMGGDVFQVRAMIEAAKTHVADNGLVPGQEVHVTLVPSLTKANRIEPVRFSVFGDGHDHKVTVARNQAGEFVASNSPVDERMARAMLGNEDNIPVASLYTSFYQAALAHGIDAETILKILRIHAYETDFRRRVRASDQVEWFFDSREDDKGLDGALGELLMTSITVGGESQRFYRFRSTDGVIDYYDEGGNTSRKFLMRRPVRGEALRLSSGFGPRRHPILGYVRSHNGVDWSGPIGTPIMAAGAGTIEEAGRKGEYGNYVRIRHANGYKTSYAHMSRFAPGISEGVRVVHGQVIGFIGNTGLSSGPHLHYEVLVNNQPVDPMSIQVPRDRKLTGNQLRDFQKERARIEELLRRNPIATRVQEQAQSVAKR